MPLFNYPFNKVQKCTEMYKEFIKIGNFAKCVYQLQLHIYIDTYIWIYVCLLNIV